MTPAALTPAAKRAAAKRGVRAQGDGGHPRALRRPVAPSAPRRVSGPVKRAAVATPAPVAAPAAPRTVSRPTAPPRQRPTAPTRRRTAAPARKRASARTSRIDVRTLALRAAQLVRSLPDGRLIDRLVRGRAWIPALGVMLAGIVFMQVELLKTNASIGRAVRQTARLQAKNESFRALYASSVDPYRIEQKAYGLGLRMPAPTDVGFVNAGVSAIGQALANLQAPNATLFLNASSGNGGVAGLSQGSSGASSSQVTSSVSATLAPTLVSSTTSQTGTSSSSSTGG